MIALLAAMKEETAAISGGMSVAKRLKGDGFEALEGEYHGKNVLLVRTGVGKKQAAKAAGFALDNYPLTVMVSLGFAGGLAPEVKGGDIVICERVRCGDGEGEDLGKSLACDAGLVSLARGLALRQRLVAHLGDGVTVPRAAYRPEEKRRLGTAFTAAEVEMEGYWVAKRSAEKGIPFLNLRAVSDPVEDVLPPIGRLMDLSSGSWSRGKAFLYFVSHPRHAMPLLKVFRNFRRGKKNLSTLVASLVESL